MMKKKSEPANITAARLILKKRKAAMSLDAINSALKKGGLKPVTAETLDKNFKHVCTKGGQKWLLGGDSASTLSHKVFTVEPGLEKKKCKAKKPCGKKVVDNKKVCPTKSACRNSGCNSATSFCSINMSSNFEVAEYNQRASLHNAMVNMPISADKPDDFVFLVGVGSWPESYRGIEIDANPNFSGVLLCPRKFMRKIEM